jgi:hypothetical protein
MRQEQEKGVRIASGVVTPTKRRPGSERGHRCRTEHHDAGITVKLHREAPGVSCTGVGITFHLKALGTGSNRPWPRHVARIIGSPMC